MFEVGRVCLKTAGREAGKYCVIVKKVDENFVMVTGPKSLTKVKRRRCNINHLEPITESISIKSDASDTEVLKAYQEASIFSRLGLEKPGKAKGPEKPVEKRERKEKPKREKKSKEPGRKAKGKKAGEKKAKTVKKTKRKKSKK
jgi:large subunit ribosomal protein L14e